MNFKEKRKKKNDEKLTELNLY